MKEKTKSMGSVTLNTWHSDRRVISCQTCFWIESLPNFCEWEIFFLHVHNPMLEANPVGLVFANAKKVKFQWRGMPTVYNWCWYLNCSVSWVWEGRLQKRRITSLCPPHHWNHIDIDTCKRYSFLSYFFCRLLSPYRNLILTLDEYLMDR